WRPGTRSPPPPPSACWTPGATPSTPRSQRRPRAACSCRRPAGSAAT
ncbi:MAG: hypothetical protein AVDCRST_MAG16-3110, partial [uncultured Frankineae bacterium]